MRNGTVVYHCKRISSPTADVEEFAPPVAYRLRFGFMTIQPKSGNIYQQTFGEFKEYEQTVCCQPYQKWVDEIHEGDLFYLEKVPDTSSDEFEARGYGYDANYKVVKRNPQNLAIFYALKSIIE